MPRGVELDIARGEPVLVAVGLALVLLGAIGATVTSRHAEQRGRATVMPLLLVPFGVLVGAGAAMVRGWDLVVSMVVGGVLVPLVGAVGRWLEVRRAGGRP